jgi:catechol 2,3-dioxygenase-like lactoylglutathione lyase family enzyme
MSSSPGATYSFTKVVVDDLDAMAHYYSDVYGLQEIQRVKDDVDGAPIEEIILGIDGSYGGLILWKWLARPGPPIGEVILGFTTPDIEALFARAETAGATVRERPKEHDAAPGFLVGFVADPEGHLAEVVQPLEQA